MVNTYIQKITRSIQRSKFSVPVILLLFSILAFAPLLPFLGFYWDGWPYLWQYHVFGPAGYPAFVSSDRPYSAFIFMILTNLFGTNAIFYHIFVLLCRWLSGWAFWWILQQLWPKNRTFNVYAAILFILYPGFLQQPIALPYVHHFSHMALFLFSIGAMLASTHDRKKYVWLTVLSLIAQLSIFSLEYFASLEFIRPFLIWIMLRNENSDAKDRFKQVLRNWSPYLVILIVFYVWRVFFFSFPTYEPKMLNEFNQDFSAGFFDLITQAFNDLLTVTYGAVKNLFHFPRISEVGYFTTYGYWGIVGIAAIFSAFVLHLIEPPLKQKGEHKSGKPYLEPLGIAILALLLAGAIFWVTKLTVRIEFAWDRLTLAYMFGVAILFASVLFLLIHYPKIRIACTTVFIALTVGFHFLNAMDFKHDWDSFKNFFWQLTWRIPDLEENTIMMTTNFPLKYYSDNSMTAPLNWTYDPMSDDETLSYVFYFSDVRLKVGRLSALEKDLPIDQWYRSFSFTGNTSDTVVIRYDPPGCMQVLDEKYANAGIIPNLTQLEADQIPLSNLDRIITNPEVQSVPPIDILGEEIDHGWCYYFEKADLARQTADWETIITLKDQADQSGVKPRIPSEWLPFFEAFIRTENWEQVQTIIHESLAVDEKYTPGILFTWDRVIAESGIVPDAATLLMIDNMRD